MGLLSCRPARSGPAHRGPPEPALCIGVSCSFLFEHCSAFPCFGGLTAMTPPQLGALPSREVVTLQPGGPGRACGLRVRSGSPGQVCVPV